MPPVLLLPDVANERLLAAGRPRVFYCLPETPLLARDATGGPIFSLTLTLTRRPEPGEESIYELIDRGILSLCATLALPIDSLAAPGPARGAEVARFLPLFVQSATFELRSPGAGPAARPVVASGPKARGALGATLGRRAALDVLFAVDGKPSGIEVVARVSYRTTAARRTVRMHGDGPAMYRFLRARLNEEDVPAAEVRASLVEMLRAGVLSAADVTADGRAHALESDAGGLFEIFMSVAGPLFLAKSPPLEGLDDHYRLSSRPPPPGQLAVERSIASPEVSTIELAGSLDKVLGGAISGDERERFVRLVSPSPAGGIGPVPPLIRSSGPRARSPREPDERAPTTRLALIEGRAQELSAVLQPNALAEVPAHVMIASAEGHVVGGEIPIVGVGTPISGGQVLDWVKHDAMFPEDGKRDSLPLVLDAAAPIWANAANAGAYFYLPTYEVHQPTPNEDPGRSPFLFTFRKSGATASGAPGFDGTVRFRLGVVRSAAVVAALEALGNPDAEPVPMTNLSVAFDLPFRDQNGETRRQLFPAEIVKRGDAILYVTVRLLDAWVLLSYGALSVSGFQSEPARLSVAFSYLAYVPVQPHELQLAYVPKTALIEIATTRGEARRLGGAPHFFSPTATYRTPEGEIRLRREPRLNGGGSRARHAGASVDRADDGIPTRSDHTPFIIAEPILDVLPAVMPMAQQFRYARQTLVREASTDILFPCDTLGALYLEETDGGSEAVGCQNALQLGQTTYLRYKHMPELTHALYEVHRSLQQPGRFLVMPKRYLITRFAASNGSSAYRPVIFVYSVIDENSSTNDRALFEAALEPDLPPYVRRELRAKLAAQAQDPVLEYPTELSTTTTTYTWTIGTAMQVDPSAVKTPLGFRVSLATDLLGTLLLVDVLETVGVSGTAKFALSDGSTLEAELRLALGDVTGPWENGPLEVALAGGSARLTNRTERPVDVSQVVAYRGVGVGVPILVGARIEPGASLSVGVGADALEAYPVFTTPPGNVALKEIRSFVEDIETNVIFVDLVNHVDHGLTGLSIRARLKGLRGTRDVPMTLDPAGQNPATGSITFTLPLTTFLSKRVVQYRVTKTFKSKPKTQKTGWLDWDLKVNGNVVQIRWEDIK